MNRSSHCHASYRCYYILIGLTERWTFVLSVTVWDSREELVLHIPSHTPTLPLAARFFLVGLPFTAVLTLHPPSTLHPLHQCCRENCTETTTMMRQQKDLLGETLLCINWVGLRLGGGTVSSCVCCFCPRSVPLRHSLETRAVSCERCQVGLVLPTCKLESKLWF